MGRSNEFQYPKTPDDAGYDQFRLVHELYGSNDIDALFHGGDISVSPWPRAHRLKSGSAYDPARERAAVFGDAPLEEFDPRHLHSGQPMVTRAGVAHYLSGGQFERTGQTFADQTRPGNKNPIVYPVGGRNDIRSGHHRAVAALLQGRPLRARRA